MQVVRHLVTFTLFLAVAAPSAAQTFHAQRLGDGKSPAARIDVMSWLAGRWEGEGLGGLPFMNS